MTISNVYTESLPFLVATLLLGLLAPTAGAGLVAAFVPFLISSGISTTSSHKHQ